MKKLFTLLLGILIVSCSSDGMHPDYEKNLATAKKFIELHNSESLDAQVELLHDDLDWSPPMYDSKNYGKDEHIDAMKGYHDMLDNIEYEADYWLPGVDPETGKNDGSVRTYGTWTGIHTDSGKEFSLRSYHAMAFKDGKIVGGGDYFDFTGFINSFE